MLSFLVMAKRFDGEALLIGLRARAKKAGKVRLYEACEEYGYSKSLAKRLLYPEKNRSNYTIESIERIEEILYSAGV